MTPFGRMPAHRGPALITPALVALALFAVIVGSLPAGSAVLTSGAGQSATHRQASGLTIPSDPGFPDQWHLHNEGQTGGKFDADIDAPEAWSIATSTPVTLAVIDSGFETGHSDLAGNHSGSIQVDDPCAGLTGPDFQACFTHGTMTAGTAGAVSNNQFGVAGVAWDLPLLNVPVDLRYTSYGQALRSVADRATPSARLVALLEVQSATTVFVQPGQSPAPGENPPAEPCPPEIDSAIAYARSKGVLVVIPAGNHGVDLDTSPRGPANCSGDNVIKVAASDQHDELAVWRDVGYRPRTTTCGVVPSATGAPDGTFVEGVQDPNGTMADNPPDPRRQRARSLPSRDFVDVSTGSNYGVQSVDLAAPGSRICSTYTQNRFALWDGTSPAGPVVAAAAALAWGTDPSASYAAVRSWILGSVDRTPGLVGKVATGGRLNLHKALMTATSGSATGQTGDVIGRVTSSQSSGCLFGFFCSGGETTQRPGQAGVTVRAEGTGASAVSDSSGLYELTGLLPGTYTLRATLERSSGFFPNSETVECTDAGGATAVQVQVSAQTTQTQDFICPSGGGFGFPALGGGFGFLGLGGGIGFPALGGGFGFPFSFSL